MSQLYVALFMGQGGFWFSQGAFSLRDKIRAIGARADVYRYVDEHQAHSVLDRYQGDGWKIALWGYSLGTSTALYEQAHRSVDLLMCCAISRLESTWPIAGSTKRSILWAGSGLLSSGGRGLHFTVTNVIKMPPIPILGHLLMQVHPVVVSDTVAECKLLMEA